MRKPQERVNRWVSIWKSRLLLDSWGVTVECKDAERHIDRSDGEALPLSAEIIVDPRYNEGRIKVYPQLFTKPLGYQEVTIVHELLHIATDPVKAALDTAARKGVISERKKDDLIEGLTEYISKIIYKAYARNRKERGAYHL